MEEIGQDRGGGAGGTAPITFSVSAGALPAGLSLAAATGVISGTPTTAGAYSFTVKATDANAVATTQAYSGTIAATLAITTTTLPAPTLSTAYSQTVATSGGTAPVTFSVSAGSLPAGLSLTTSSGLISGTPTTAGAYSFTITATDANAITATQAYAGTVSGFAITTATLPPPEVLLVYSQTVTTSGGTAPISFAVTSGSLPTGLTLGASSGTVIGAVLVAGNYSFTVQATDYNGLTASQTYSGTVAAALAIATTTLPAATLNQPYNQTIATSGGVAPITFVLKSGQLPTGLTLNTATGAIAGTPTASGNSKFTIQVSDVDGGQDHTNYTLKVH